MRSDQLILSIAIAIVFPPGTFQQSRNFLNSLIGCPNVSKKECTSNRDCGPGEKCRETKCVDLCLETNCGDNEGCQIIRDRHASCECLPNYERNYKDKCVLRKTCVLNSECDNTETCIDDECVNVCSEEDCDINESCKIIDNHVGSCECLPGFSRGPDGQCVTNKTCSNNEDCKLTEVCRSGDCVCSCYKKYCSGPNEGCQVARNHSSSCQCLPGYIPNTDGVGCKPQCVSNEDCGRKSECIIIDYVPTCNCISGYSYNSDKICLKDCIKAEDCDESEDCDMFDKHCFDPCSDKSSLDKNAKCLVVNHVKVVQCIHDYTGDPYDECYKICSDDNACKNTEKCYDKKCVDGCKDFTYPDNSECVVTNHIPNFICHDDYILDGSNCIRKCNDTFQCKDDEKCDGGKCLALPTCPDNSFDITSNHTKACYCWDNYDYIKDTNTCWKECTNDDVCIDSHRCKNNTNCVDACEGVSCIDQINTKCVASSHIGNCECLENYERKSPTECRKSCGIDTDCDGTDVCKDNWCIN